VPRARPLGAFARPPRVFLDIHRRDRLCQFVKRSNASDLPAEVEQVLSNYWLHQARDAETPARMIATLTRIRKQVRKGSLPQSEILQLPEALRMALGIADEQLTDLARLDCSLSEAIQRLEKHVRRCRRPDQALRITMEGLATIFERYASPKLRRRSAVRREFMFTACEYGDIPCPDPIDQRTRFDRLLKPAIRPRRRDRAIPRKRLKALTKKLKGVAI